MELTALDILIIAEAAEAAAADFYRRNAAQFETLAERRLCLRLAARHHRQAFYWGRTQASVALTDPGRRDAGRAASPWRAESMIGLTWLGDAQAGRGWLGGHETAPQVLRDAHRRVRDLVTFYRGLTGFAQGTPALRTVHRVARMSALQREEIEVQLLEATRRTSEHVLGPAREEGLHIGHGNIQ